MKIPPPGTRLTDAEIDRLYGLEPAIASDSTAESDRSLSSEFATVVCPYCGEPFETRADVSSGSCAYVEDCQVCCQPIEMELRVAENGTFEALLARRGDA